mgnify:CR=1 FL=1
MRIESKLCHINEKMAVVQVNAWDNEKNLGSALGEGATVEIAEDNAISRLKKRLNINSISNTTLKSINENENNSPLKIKSPKSKIIENTNVNNGPFDWSNELTAIDSEIKRLGWSRENEINFLQKNFGYNNRNKITNYNDIVKYLNLLTKIDNKNPSKEDSGIINTLIEESEFILRELSWDHIQGREYLKNEFNVLTRKELSETQLVSFVEKLKLIRNQNQSY